MLQPKYTLLEHHLFYCNFVYFDIYYKGDAKYPFPPGKEPIKCTKGSSGLMSSNNGKYIIIHLNEAQLTKSGYTLVF